MPTGPQLQTMLATRKRPGSAQSERSQETRRAKPEPVSTPITSYDSDTGLVYDERQITAVRGATNWITNYRTPSIARNKERSNKGPGLRKLTDMVLNKLAIESQQLSPEALQFLPWELAQQIWTRICEKYDFLGMGYTCERETWTDFITAISSHIIPGVFLPRHSATILRITIIATNWISKLPDYR